MRSNHKRPLPAFPRHIGIVTSLQAAALRDVLSPPLRRRAPQLQATIFPCPVQGDGAARSLPPSPMPTRTASTPSSAARGGGWLKTSGPSTKKPSPAPCRCLPGSGDQWCRSRNRLHHCRLCRRPARADPTAAAELVARNVPHCLPSSALQSRLARRPDAPPRAMPAAARLARQPAERTRPRNCASKDRHWPICGVAFNWHWASRTNAAGQSLVALGRHLQQARRHNRRDCKCTDTAPAAARHADALATFATADET